MPALNLPELVSRMKQSMSNRFRRVYARDRNMIIRLNLDLLNNMLWPLFVGFICLNFLDAYSTVLAIKAGPVFQERNPVAALLFDMRFRGFLLAMVLKYLPALPLFYLVFVSDRDNRHPYEIRLVKFAALAALISADIFLLYVVAINNIPSLVGMRAS